MDKSKFSLLFLGKEDDEYCEKALQKCRQSFSVVDSYCGGWGDPLPSGLDEWQGDYIVSYLSRWVVPDRILKNAVQCALNFHPAPPEYPGIGCINFALYDGVKEYGVTCHNMDGKVDTGKIFKVNSFPVEPEDTVKTLLMRTYTKQFDLFLEVLDYLVTNRVPPTCDATWARDPYTRREFNELMKIHCDMSREEVHRRVRATSYGEWQPILEFNGFEFKLVNK